MQSTSILPNTPFIVSASPTSNPTSSDLHTALQPCYRGHSPLYSSEHHDSFNSDSESPYASSEVTQTTQGGMASHDVPYWSSPKPHSLLHSLHHRPLPSHPRHQSTAEWAANLLTTNETHEYEDILDIVDAYGYGDDDNNNDAASEQDDHSQDSDIGTGMIDLISVSTGSEKRIQTPDNTINLSREMQTVAALDRLDIWSEPETEVAALIPIEITDDTSEVLPYDDYPHNTYTVDDKLQELEQCQDHRAQPDNKLAEWHTSCLDKSHINHDSEFIDNDYTSVTRRIDRFLESQAIFTRELKQSPHAVREKERYGEDATLVVDHDDLDRLTPMNDQSFSYKNHNKENEYLQDGDSYDDLLTDEDEDDLTDRRRTAFREVLTTERSYVKSLKRLCECFIYPLRSTLQQRKGVMRNIRMSIRAARATLTRTERSNSLSSITPGSGRCVGGLSTLGVDSVSTRGHSSITESDVRLIFGNIEMILVMHKRLLRAMEDRHRDWSLESKISDIFRQLVQIIPLYQTYVENFTNAITTLERLSAQSSQFAKFINQDDQNSIDSMNLKAYLSLPLRRITRYATYMTHQVDLIPSNHDDYDMARTVFGQLTHLTNNVSASVLETENRLRLKNLERTISGLPGQISYAPRRLIHLGTLYQFLLAEDGSSKEMRFVILLDDRIIWTRETQPDRYAYKDQIMLAGAFVTDLADTVLYENAFRVVSSSGKEALLCAESGEVDKRDWLAHIQTALNRSSGDISIVGTGIMPEF